MRILVLALLIGGGQALAGEFPEGPAKKLVEEKCSGCHQPTVITGLRASREDWEGSVDRMTAKGVWLSDEEFDAVVDYLATYFGPPTINVNTASAADLEEQLALTPAEAKTIVMHRNEHGKFKDWRDVSKAAGVAAQKIEQAKDKLTF